MITATHEHVDVGSDLKLVDVAIDWLLVIAALRELTHYVNLDFRTEKHL